MPFELLKSEPVFQGHAFKIRRDYLKDARWPRNKI